MKIVSWNIRHGGGKQSDSISDQLARWEPSIVCLSEFRGTKPSQEIATRLSEHGLGFQMTTVVKSRPVDNRLLVASEYPITRLECHGKLQEIGSWLHVEVDCEIPFRLAAMYVPNRGKPSHLKYQIHDEVIEMMKSEGDNATIAMGDTNTGQPDLDESAKFFNKHEARWFDRISETGWIDAWRHRNPEKREYTWHTHTGSGFRLDQAFVTQKMNQRVTSIEYRWGRDAEDQCLSDHAAIMVELDDCSQTGCESP
ncbi:endonuclease/exonuclease/phosphatase family protein [Planctomycetes bacterium CA13]